MIDAIRDLQRKLGDAALPLVFFALRIIVGYGFFRAGYGKIGDLESVARFFGSLGIPSPEIAAVVVAVAEMAVGVLLMLGLATRVAAAIGIGVLTVAVITAHTGDVAVIFSNPGKFLTASPIPYLMMFLVFACVGPGALSVDRAIGLERPRE